MESLAGPPSKARKTMKTASNEALDEAVWIWFAQKRNEGVPVSGHMISEKASWFNEKMNGSENFKASAGWLEGFKKRHGIRQLTVGGEKLSAAGEQIVSEFKVKFKNIVSEKNLTRDQIYNADETGLFYKALPTKTLASFSEKYAPGFKMQKQRVTIMLCANASGNHRLPLLLIGTAKKPRCFKQLNIGALPVKYYNQKNAWMNQEIFADWFHNVFVPYVRKDLKSKNLPPNAILLLDNAKSHPTVDQLSSDDGNITLLFLPPNTTPLLQPMDQSVIETFKRLYRKKFMQNLLNEDNMTILDYWKQFDLRDVTYFASDAWTEVTNQTLIKCWNKLFPVELATTSYTDVNLPPSQPLIRNEEAAEIEEMCALGRDLELENTDVMEWLGCDYNETGIQLLTDDEIAHHVLNTDESEVIEYDGAEYDEEAMIMMTKESTDVCQEAKEAMYHLEQFIDWYEKQNDADCINTVILRRFRAFAYTKSEKVKKQLLVTDFFKKTDTSD